MCIVYAPQVISTVFRENINGEDVVLSYRDKLMQNIFYLRSLEGVAILFEDSGLEQSWKSGA